MLSQQPSTTSAPVGWDYAHTAVRVEQRPSAAAPVWSRQKLAATIDALAGAGAEAWWFSAAVPPAQLLFDSRHMPAGDHRMPVEDFHWAIDRAHECGLTVLSHYPFNAAPRLVAEHPDWQMQFLGPDGAMPGDGRTPCFASPYLERLLGLSLEIVNDLRFDGIWFDCTALSEAGQIGCICPRCAALFEQATGFMTPTEVNFDDEAFRQWFRWRQTWFMGVWRDFAAAFQREAPGKTLVLKHSARLNHSGETANPFSRYPAGVVAAVEVDWRPNQALLQMKYLRAITGNTSPAESWLGGSDGTSVYQPGRPDPDPAGMELFSLTCATGGGVASMSSRGDASAMVRSVAQAVKPISPYIGGEPVRFAGLLISNSTLDFAHRVGSTDHSRWEREMWKGAFPAWHTIHGTHYLLNALHLPSEVLLEDDLEPSVLSRYPLIILPDVQCISDAQARALGTYVEVGGMLLAVGDTGTRDEWGVLRTHGALDEVLGVTSRSEEAAHLIYHQMDACLRGGNQPVRYMISGRGRMVEVADGVHVLARGEVIFNRMKRTLTGDLPVTPPQCVDGVAVWERAVGRGWVVGLANNFGPDYATNNNRRTRLVLDTLIRRHAAPLYEVDAPPNVVVTAWQQGGELVFHILNQPASYCHLNAHNDPFHAEDVPPTGSIVISLPLPCDAVHSVRGTAVNVTTTDAETAITLPRLERHEVIRCIARTTP